MDDGTGIYENRIKIMREESIGYYAWDTSASGINDYTDISGIHYYGTGINQWGESENYEGADLMRLLNPGYENENINNSLYWNRGSGTCYEGYSNATTSCDFSDTGLTEEAKSMIEDAKWYTSAVDQRDVTASISYQQERGNRTGIADIGITVKKTINWVGKVALIYSSDYGYASSECYKDVYLLDEINENDYRLEKCTSSNWIFNENNQNFLNPTAYGTSGIRRLWNLGHLSNGLSANLWEEEKPAVYLSPNVKITSGNGTIESPYQLEMP